MEAKSPIYEHGLTDEMLEDLAHLRKLRIQLAENQLKDLDQTQSDLSARGIAESDSFASEDLKVTLEEKLEDLKSRLDEPKAIFIDEIQFFLEVAN